MPDFESFNAGILGWPAWMIVAVVLSAAATYAAVAGVAASLLGHDAAIDWSLAAKRYDPDHENAFLAVTFAAFWPLAFIVYTCKSIPLAAFHLTEHAIAWWKNRRPILTDDKGPSDGPYR